MDQASGGFDMEAFGTLMKQLSDSKLMQAQRELLMKKVEMAQTVMQAEMAGMSAPANIAKAQQSAREFGCERISVGIQGGNLNGDMRCAENVAPESRSPAT
jgi:hypothetical protein